MRRWVRALLCFLLRIGCPRPVRADLDEEIWTVRRVHRRAQEAIERADQLLAIAAGHAREKR